MRNLTIFIFAAVLALGAYGCNTGQADLKARALNFVQSAHDTNTAVNSMTPVMQEALKTQLQSNPGLASGDGGFAMPGVASQLQRLGREALLKVTDENVEVQVKGKWGLAIITVSMPYGQEVIKSQWIKVDGQWYAYSASGGEVDAYGEFPYFAS